MNVNLCENCIYYNPSEKYPHHTYCKKARTITSDICTRDDCPHYTGKMNKEQAIKELSAMSKTRFNNWFDALPPRAQFIASASNTEDMRSICAEWYISQSY